MRLHGPGVLRALHVGQYGGEPRAGGGRLRGRLPVGRSAAQRRRAPLRRAAGFSGRRGRGRRPHRPWDQDPRRGRPGGGLDADLGPRGTPGPILEGPRALPSRAGRLAALRVSDCRKPGRPVLQALRVRLGRRIGSVGHARHGEGPEGALEAGAPTDLPRDPLCGRSVRISKLSGVPLRRGLHCAGTAIPEVRSGPGGPHAYRVERGDRPGGLLPVAPSRRRGRPERRVLLLAAIPSRGPGHRGGLGGERGR
mmetsp:Transcript_4181/g.14622  ORF Transcript_4181/g.14622 Transcript_4181/m.14622 type:complete len:252 (-) Transcript_4181:905-1660(-)